MTSASLVLIAITLLAATVNGALGYGFSSITVPVALLFYTNRILNPALVWVEVVLNGYVLWVNRASVPHVWRRVAPMILGLIPGVVLAESPSTAAAYYVAGMFSTESAGLLPYILPSLVIGIPLGVTVIRHVRPETFRRICMSFDAWVVGFGISTLLQQLHVIESGAAFSVLAGVGTLDIWLLYRFFKYQAPPNRGGALEAAAAGS